MEADQIKRKAKTPEYQGREQESSLPQTFPFFTSTILYLSG